MQITSMLELRKYLDKGVEGSVGLLGKLVCVGETSFERNAEGWI